MAQSEAGTSFPEDYHDYVFKGGKLVGDFDNMYRFAAEVPWHQDKGSESWSSEVGMLMLKDRAPFDTILEIACGLGYISSKLRQLSSQKDSTLDAFDVSPEVFLKARGPHSEIGFYVDDIARTTFHPSQQVDAGLIDRDMQCVCKDNFQTQADASATGSICNMLRTARNIYPVKAGQASGGPLGTQSTFDLKVQPKRPTIV